MKQQSSTLRKWLIFVTAALSIFILLIVIAGGNGLSLTWIGFTFWICGFAFASALYWDKLSPPEG